MGAGADVNRNFLRALARIISYRLRAISRRGCTHRAPSSSGAWAAGCSTGHGLPCEACHLAGRSMHFVFLANSKKSTDTVARLHRPWLCVAATHPYRRDMGPLRRLAQGRFAHALGKAVFLTAPSALDIPFYLLYICSSYTEANCLGYLDLIE